MSMSKIVRTVADILFPFIMIFGFYIVIHGHLTPGGGFQGGAVIATGVILLLIAHRHGEVVERISPGDLKTTEAVGLIAFLCTGLAATVDGSAFLTNWLVNTGLIFGDSVAYGINPGDLNTGGVIPVLNFAVGIEVLGALSAIVLAMLWGTRRGDAE
ncbi:MAG: MnhB domain-containing protein [Methanoculleaceae archaeon]